MDKTFETQIFINSDELQGRILECIGSAEFDKYYNATVFNNDMRCKQAMMHGMLLGGMLASTCKTHIVQTVSRSSNFDKITTSEKTLIRFLRYVFDEGYTDGYNGNDSEDCKYITDDWLSQKYDETDKIWDIIKNGGI